MQNPYIITHCNIIRNHRIKRNETIEEITENFVNFAAFIKSLYKKESVNYPKFYKMDNLGKLGFMAAEMIFKESPFLELKNIRSVTRQLSYPVQRMVDM